MQVPIYNLNSIEIQASRDFSKVKEGNNRQQVFFETIQLNVYYVHVVTMYEGSMQALANLYLYGVKIVFLLDGATSYIFACIGILLLSIVSQVWNKLGYYAIFYFPWGKTFDMKIFKSPKGALEPITVDIAMAMCLIEISDFMLLHIYCMLLLSLDAPHDDIFLMGKVQGGCVIVGLYGIQS